MRYVEILAWMALGFSFSGCARAGDLTPVAPSRDDLTWITVPYEHAGMKSNYAMRREAEAIGPPAPGANTVHPRAVVVSFFDSPLKVAVDSRDREDAKRNLLRLDFSGQAKFDDECVVTPEAREAGPGMEDLGFGWTSTTLKLDGQRVPVLVAGRYSQEGGKLRQTYISIAAAAAGSCRFGTKAHAVRLVGADGNLHLGDRFDAIKANGRICGLKVGDTVVVDTGDDRFKSSIKCLLGQPIMVDGAWYTVLVSADGKKMRASPFRGPLGQIKVSHRQWSAVVVGSKYVLRLQGDEQPVTVPCDDYIVWEYEISTDVGKGADKALLSSCAALTPAYDKWRVFNVRARQTTELMIGPPLTAEPVVHLNGDEVNIDLRLTDAAGLRVANLYVPGAELPRPRLEILNSDGENVHSATMGFG